MQTWFQCLHGNKIYQHVYSNRGLPPTHFLASLNLFLTIRTSKYQEEFQLFSWKSFVCWPGWFYSPVHIPKGTREKWGPRIEMTSGPTVNQRENENWVIVLRGWMKFNYHKTFLALRYYAFSQSFQNFRTRWPFLSRSSDPLHFPPLLFHSLKNSNSIQSIPAFLKNNYTYWASFTKFPNTRITPSISLCYQHNR